MADSQISTVVIPCLCVQMNNQQFISPEGVIGAIENVPCRASLIEEVLYWCSPVKDEGIFDALQFRLAIGDNLAQPTFDSFLVQRIEDKLTNYTWWVYVLTKNDFKNSCNSCCGDTTVPMPGVNGSFNPVIAPCQTICAENSDGDVEVVFGLPSKPVGFNYFPTGSYNNNSLTAAAAAGYATTGALLTFLNTNWTNIGSPNVTFVWSVSGDGLTLIATGGNAGDELCVTANLVPA